MSAYPTLAPDRIRFNLGYLSTPTAISDPTRMAVIDVVEGSERTCTYGQLETRLNKVAAFLSGLGMQPGERVAVIIGNRREFIETVYGAMRAGLVPVLVNTKLGAEGLGDSMQFCGASCVVLDRECGEAAAKVTERLGIKHKILLGPQRHGWHEYESSVTRASVDFAAPDIASTAIADLCFTSGSSGEPKAVMTSHRAVLLKLYIYANVIKSLIKDELRTLIPLPIFHANARLSMGSAFQTGGLVVIQPRFEPRATLINLSRHKITYFLGVAPAYSAMIKEAELLSSLDFSTLRILWVGSAAAGGDLMARTARALDVDIIHSYGSTEAGGAMQAEPRRASFESCGTPLPGVEVKLVDPDNPTAVPGNTGELWLKSEWLASGYWQRQALTAEKFIDGWYRSGDLFKRDSEGRYYFTGRVDDMFNVGGEKVYPLEVERVLEQHPEVLNAAVAAIVHKEKGEVPAAMVILAPGAQVTVEELKAFFLERGATYAHPRRIDFVAAFPLTASGKVDRKAVRAILSAADGKR